ncbi:MAG TPA: tetratricopeptide repeat protein [Planctomycetaceae bacterium]|nr:tetratricopeptide repeat protein [Planctomycetaceae bacterium]
MSKENWDYAVQMFGQCCTVVPDNLVYRQTLRNCEFRKYKNNKSGASMAGMRLMGIRSKVKKARNAKNWKELMEAAEEGLAVNPWDAQLNADLGEGARSLGYDEIAVFGYRLAVDAEGKNKEYLEGLANALQTKGDFDGARKCWETMYKLDPLDGRARSMMTAMDSEKIIDRSGLDTAKSGKEVAQGYEKSVRGNVNTGADNVSPGDSPEIDLKQAIRKDPANPANYQKLGDLLRREGRLQEALAMFLKAHEISGDAVVREQAEDVQLDMIRKNRDLAREVSKKNPADAQAKEQADALELELRKQEIETFTRWSERRPNDLKLKYELAERFMADGKYPQATKLLQQASGDVRLEAPVAFNLGKCFLQQKQNSLALRQFEKAVAKFNSTDHQKQYIASHYFLGRLHEEAKELEKAIEHYTEVIMVDIEYRDAKTRMDKLNEQLGGSNSMTDLSDM